MQTDLSAEFKGTRDGDAAEAILRKCVHCGFCTATCPTYQLLGDELDGPRGRIYLIKQVLEGGEVTRSTQLHLDRCLTCRNCETTCPSGVRLRPPGRHRPQDRRRTGAAARRRKGGALAAQGGPDLAAVRAGHEDGPAGAPAAARGAEEQGARAGAARAGVWPDAQHARKVLMLAGCVQPAMMPNINSATARVLDAAGIQTLVARQGRLLRRGAHAPERPRRRPGRHAPQHRRLVAIRRSRRRRGHRDERVGLRRRGQGIRPRPGRTTRPMPPRPRASAR